MSRAKNIPPLVPENVPDTDLGLVGAEFGRVGLAQRHGHAPNGVVVRTALQRRKHGLIGAEQEDVPSDYCFYWNDSFGCSSETKN